MKRSRISILIGIVVLCVLMLLLFNKRGKSPSTNILADHAPATSELKEERSANTQMKEGTVDLSREKAPSAIGTLEATIRSNAQRLKESFIRPIAFYGKVVDEENRPVSGVRVVFEWNNPSQSRQENQRVTTSDDNGFFSLESVFGINLVITLEKAGYYVSKRSASFDYVYAPELEHNVHQPDAANPVVFRMRRKGSGTDLLTSQRGISPDITVAVPRDGTPVRVDIFKGAIDSNGQVEIRQTKPEYEKWKQAQQWEIQIFIPNGGLIENSDEFPYLAPESGYSREIGFVFQKAETNWTTYFRRQFYMAFGNPRLYGWFTIESALRSAEVHISYAINPDGSRYLEPKEPTPVKRELPPGVTERIPGHGE